MWHVSEEFVRQLWRPKRARGIAFDPAGVLAEAEEVPQPFEIARRGNRRIGPATT
jgi:hypothetical protein